MTNPMNIENLKKVFLSIIIGAGITFVATVVEGLLEYIRVNLSDVAGIGAGVTYFLKTWKTTLLG